MSDLASSSPTGHAHKVAQRLGHYGWAAPSSLRGRLTLAKAQARRGR